MPPVVYTLLRALLRHALRVFFRDLRVEGLEQVPPDGPLLLAANHPNTLIDVLLVATFLQRRVGFVAKAPLFANPLVGALLRWLGAVPVYRRVDGPVDATGKAKNAQALAGCEEAVAAGRAIAVFPEGVSQGEPRLQALKTGLARIALGAEERAPGQVVVVPVSLVYDDPETFRSRAHVTYSAPIRVAPYREQGERAGDPFVGVRALTEAIREELEEGMVHVDRPQHDPLVEGLDAIYGGLVADQAGGRLAATAQIANAVNAFAERDPGRVQRVQERLTAYTQALAAAGVDDVAVRARPRPTSVGAALGLILGAPLALWGAANHFVLYHLPRVVLTVLPVDPLYASTVKLLTGLLALGVCYGVQGAAVHALAPRAGLDPWTVTCLYLGTLPPCGVGALLWLEGLAARGRRAAARRARRRLAPGALDELLRLRGELVSDLDAARAAFLAEQPSDVGELADDPL